jgi:hypothetical protein
MASHRGRAPQVNYLAVFFTHACMPHGPPKYGVASVSLSWVGVSDTTLPSPSLSGLIFPHHLLQKYKTASRDPLTPRSPFLCSYSCFWILFASWSHAHSPVHAQARLCISLLPSPLLTALTRPPLESGQARQGLLRPAQHRSWDPRHQDTHDIIRAARPALTSVSIQHSSRSRLSRLTTRLCLFPRSSLLFDTCSGSFTT